ncbi:nitroreductase family protein [Butyrivibrio sp. INlla14]|uniref:nitroreductase family protein n=1 Tax=Butyrivibrio sp. INlla14 TaxID=1520808 RepID=UPI0008768795|nr:nitroreductase family protein [Butyrivibrio sp. INlla14]SCY17145.1 Nitroreductase [Butyrivibrio sp. INlla14]
MSDFLELVKSRRSVRTFDGRMPKDSVIDELKTFSEGINNPYGIPVRFVFLDAAEHGLSSPVLSGEKQYVSAVVSKGKDADVAYGYSFEALLMKAHEMGLGTVWIGGTMPREKFEKASCLVDDEVMPCVSPLGYISKKMSVKETLMRKGVKADSRLDFEELFFSESFEPSLTKVKAMEAGLFDALESVRLAPSAVNKQPWRVVMDQNAAHFFVKHDKGFTTPDYDLQRIDVGIALYHFERELIEEGRNPRLETNTPSIALPQQMDYVASYRW